MTYYISVPEARYRHAIEPELIILAVFLLWSLSARARRQEPNPVQAGHAEEMYAHDGQSEGAKA